MVEVVDKSEMFVQCDEGGVVKVKVDEEKVKEKALSDEIARDITQLMMKLEDKMGTPQDFEWGWEKGHKSNQVLLYLCISKLSSFSQI